MNYCRSIYGKITDGNIAVGRAPIETGAKVIASPDHTDYTADKAVAKVLVSGRSGLIAAIDGVGSGGKNSALAAEIVQIILGDLETQLVITPTINVAIALLKNSIFDAVAKIQDLQKAGRNTGVDTTVSAGMVCESPDGRRRFLVTANVGDSRIYMLRGGAVFQLTVDHSFVQNLVATGMVKPEEVFSHPQRNVVYKTVGSLNDPSEIDFKVTEIQEGDIFLAVSDGVSDNITPQGLPVAVKSEFRKAYDPSTKKPDLNRFASGLALRARNIQTGTKANHAKPDDICVAVLST